MPEKLRKQKLDREKAEAALEVSCAIVLLCPSSVRRRFQTCLLSGVGVGGMHTQLTELTAPWYYYFPKQILPTHHSSGAGHYRLEGGKRHPWAAAESNGRSICNNMYYICNINVLVSYWNWFWVVFFFIFFHFGIGFELILFIFFDLFFYRTSKPLCLTSVCI